uniref:Adaptin_N domain-containing protein n=1 Tax=Rhabditophanes sp. KR3021 TaxID=114890 RepID=A0AC35UGR7_9BILA
MALVKFRSNLDHLFDKNLKDLVRGIRSNKDNESKYITQCMEEIKTELKHPDTFVKANAIEKLAYLQMLGYDISWAAFNIVEVMCSRTFCVKRVGYLAATQCFREHSDILMLTTNMVRKDLQSSNLYHVGIALSGLACFVTPDLARDLATDVVNLLSSSRPYVRKKAVLLLYKIFLKYPESLKPTFPTLKEKLEDEDAGVQSAAVNVICELARKNPKNYITLAPVFFKLMTTSSNNWMLIKIIKLFGALVPIEPRLGKKLLEPLTNLINSTSAMSLLYECINTVVAVLISISSGGPGDHTASIQLCVQKLGVLIEDSDQNLKYLGLLAMGRILATHPKAVQAHKDIVLRCLDDKDESIRIRALDLLYGMVDQAEGSYYRNELLSRITSICSYNNYAYITQFEWYISVLVELTKVESANHGKLMHGQHSKSNSTKGGSGDITTGQLISEQIQDVSVRVQSIRHFSVSQMALLVENGTLLLAGSSQHRNNISEVLLAAAWICGEYAEHLSDPHKVIESMLKTKISLMPGHILSVYVQNIGKLYAILINQYEKEDDWDAVETLDNLMLSKLPEFQICDHLEAQERACNLHELVKFVEAKHNSREKMGACCLELYEGELNPVAAKAQRKVPVPEGLILDTWIGEPFPETDNEESSDESEPEPVTKGHKHVHQVPSIESTKLNHSKKISSSELKKQRDQMVENNPYYVKTSKKIEVKDEKKVVYPIKKGENASIITELQSPLEIPGVLGMTRYMAQKENTLSWSKTKKEKVSSKGKKKKSKKSKKNEGKEELSVLSSSPSEDEEEHVVVDHVVNRAEGEMPENALSTDEEVDENDLDNEFKALNIDLDEPVKESEKLTSVKPYERAPEKESRIYHVPPPLLTSASAILQTEQLKVKEKKGKGKKTKKTKKTNKSDKDLIVDIDPFATKENYDVIQSSSTAANTPSKQNDEFSQSTPPCDMYIPIGENDNLKIVYRVLKMKEKFSDITIGVIFKNKSTFSIEKLDFNFTNTMNTSLVQNRHNLIEGDLPLQLLPGLSSEYFFNFAVKDHTVSQKIRASFSYFIERSSDTKAEENIDIRVVFPSMSFLSYREIGTVAFESLLQNTKELAENYSTKIPSEGLNLDLVIAKLVSHNFYLVHKPTDNCASMYGVLVSNNEDKQLCILVKVSGDNINFDIRGNDSQLVHSISTDFKDLFAKTTLISTNDI